MPASVSADVRSELRTPEASPPPRRRTRKRAAPRRWVREVQGTRWIVGLVIGCSNEGCAREKRLGLIFHRTFHNGSCVEMNLTNILTQETFLTHGVGSAV